ncbi:MAG: hypothetical protein Hyperionvirus16_26 [Hyperionvirus sp.]|uniref:Uncharacterized protein n=1 Tax=Hyperionvirus sp. TaxID=2487770 RepID=A0A3G5ACR7_9VIRU|nr:MAG: hypothetical protein Hyperionvirus16_26 [Hyperionvirus sp.]
MDREQRMSEQKCSGCAKNFLTTSCSNFCCSKWLCGDCLGKHQGEHKFGCCDKSAVGVRGTRCRRCQEFGHSTCIVYGKGFYRGMYNVLCRGCAINEPRCWKKCPVPTCSEVTFVGDMHFCFDCRGLFCPKHMSATPSEKDAKFKCPLCSSENQFVGSGKLRNFSQNIVEVL